MTPPAELSASRLAQRTIEAFRERGWTLALAESCTGGLVSSWLTAIPGSSVVFLGAVVPYADLAKYELLDVPPGLVATHGAVSAQVAEAMAHGVRQRLNSSVAAAVTGIAGPGGSRPGKPVGLTHVAICDSNGRTRSAEHRWQGGRDENRRRSAEAVLTALLELASD